MTQRPAWLDRTLEDCPHLDPAIPDEPPTVWEPPPWFPYLLCGCSFAAVIGLALLLAWTLGAY
jgi:hypothetical protein